MKLGFLRPLYDEIGDYVSVYLDTDRIHENAAEAIGIRWRAARKRLAAVGASPASLEAVAEVIGDPGEVAVGQAVFARQGAVTFTGALDAPPRREIARLAPLPHLMPLLAQHRPPIPHLRVSATRTGGEILAIGGSGEGWRDWVAGRQWPVHKTSVGAGRRTATRAAPRRPGTRTPNARWARRARCRAAAGCRNSRWLYSGRFAASAGNVVAEGAASWEVYALTWPPLAAGPLTCPRASDCRRALWPGVLAGRRDRRSWITPDAGGVVDRPRTG